MTGRNLRDVRIEGGHHPIQGLDHRHLTAQSRVDVCEFKADAPLPMIAIQREAIPG